MIGSGDGWGKLESMWLREYTSQEKHFKKLHLKNGSPHWSSF